MSMSHPALTHIESITSLTALAKAAKAYQARGPGAALSLKVKGETYRVRLLTNGCMEVADRVLNFSGATNLDADLRTHGGTLLIGGM